MTSKKLDKQVHVRLSTATADYLQSLNSELSLAQIIQCIIANHFSMFKDKPKVIQEIAGNLYIVDKPNTTVVTNEDDIKRIARTNWID